MEMDDPWGSPWADEVQPQHPVTIKESHDIEELAQRPTTPVKASSLALQEQTHSPWGDVNDAEDGFGDWAAVPKETGNGLDGADDGWGSSIGNEGSTHTKKDMLGSATAWDDTPTIPEENIATLAPSALPKATDVAQQPALDPWAFVSTTDEEPRLGNVEYLKDVGFVRSQGFGWDSQDKPPKEAGNSDLWGISIETTPAIEEATVGKSSGDVETLREDIVVNGDGVSEEHSANTELELLPEVKAILTEAQDQQKAVLPDVFEEPQETSKPPPSVERTSTSQEGDLVSSRPSSSPSERSQHDDVFSESPRTSLEEDFKRPPVPRKVSTKVQELVEHFDTLAKREETPEINIGRNSSAEGRTKTAELDEDQVDNTDEDDDFGDFEEGQSDIDEPAEESIPVTSPATPDSKTSKGVSHTAQQSPQISTPKKDYGPVDFIPDVSLLSQLYPNADVASTESCFVPDQVPNDSFTSTEQRKTWYRISRYGPLRKHNMGDDESYARVNWTQSQLRVDTLKAVARWIEEDRISGRVVLGGGSKAGGIFGWNEQKAAPASIDSVFATKATKQVEASAVAAATEIPREWPKGLVRDRSTSKGRSPSKPRRTSSVKSTKSPMEGKGDTQSPVANFGWNTVPEATSKSHSRKSSMKASSGSISSPIVANSPPTVQKRSSLRRSSSVARAFTPVEPANVEPSHLKRTPTQSSQAKASVRPIVPVAVSETSGFDDDWGEMISSPTASTAPAFPEPKVLRHKSSRSFGGAFSANKKSHASVVAKETGRGHRPTVSFDQILMPEKQSLQIAKSSEQIDSFSTPSNAFSSPFTQPMQPDVFSIPSNAFSDSAAQITQPSAFAAPSDAFSNTVPQRASPQTTHNDDPWASADFSFFETASAPPPKPIPAKTVSFANTRAPAPSRRPKEEMEQDRIVQSVIKGLPDLSYMLRR